MALTIDTVSRIFQNRYGRPLHLSIDGGAVDLVVSVINRVLPRIRQPVRGQLETYEPWLELIQLIENILAAAIEMSNGKDVTLLDVNAAFHAPEFRDLLSRRG